MASGLACVASRLACEGMTVADGEHLLMAEDDEAVANSLVRLLRDPALADRIGRAARRYVEDHHSWAEVARRYEELYREVGADPRRSG